MGKPTGFLEYDRVNGKAAAPLERIKNFNEFHTPLTEAQQRKQGARCMECGVPFCQSGMMMNGMVSGCPLHNLVPEWNDLVYHRKLGSGLQPPEKDQQLSGVYQPASARHSCEAACTCGLNGDTGQHARKTSMRSLRKHMKTGEAGRKAATVCVPAKRSQSSAPVRPVWLRPTS